MTIEDISSVEVEAEWHRERYAKMLQDGNPAWILEDERGPLCAYGVVILWPGVGEGWFSLIAVRDLGMMIRVLQAHLEQDIMKSFGLRRLHAIIKETFCKGRKFVKVLGFKYETTMKKYYWDGSDVAVYTRMK